MNYAAATVTNCYATGAVTGRSAVGGIAGNVNRGSVSNCYAIGNITATYTTGGVAGGISDEGKLEKSFALNPVVKGGGEYVGRVVGSNHGDLLGGNYALATMSDGGGTAFINEGGVTVTGTTHVNGANVTDANAKLPATYTAQGWNFTTVWQIQSGVNNGYPTLR